MLLTRAPLYRGLLPFSLDLHVLGAPLTFVLSQDQTLQLDFRHGSLAPLSACSLPCLELETGPKPGGSICSDMAPHEAPKDSVGRAPCACAHRELRDPSLTIELAPDVRRTQFSRTEPRSEDDPPSPAGFPTGCGQLVDRRHARGASRHLLPSLQRPRPARAAPNCLRRRREAKPNLSGAALSKSFFSFASDFDRGAFRLSGPVPQLAAGSQGLL